MPRPQKEKEEEKQKLVVSADVAAEDGNTSAGRDDHQSPIDANRNDEIQEPVQNETISTVPQKPFQIQTSSQSGGRRDQKYESDGLRRHRRIIVSIVAGLSLLSVGMGYCIVRDSIAATQVDKAFNLLLERKWTEASTAIGAIDENKISQRFARNGGNTRDVKLVLFPDEVGLTEHADALAAKGKFEESEAAYKTAMAQRFRPFSMSSYYTVDSTPWAVYQYGKLLVKMHRNKDASELLKQSNGMYVPHGEMDKVAESLGAKNVKVFERPEDGNKYATALQEARTDYNNIKHLRYSNPAEFVNRMQPVLEKIDSQMRKYPALAPGWLARADLNVDDAPDEAIRDLNHLLSMYPTLPEALEMRAKAFEQKHDYKNALEDYDRALTALPNAERLLIEKASLLAKMKRFDEAQDALDLALRQNPANIELFREKSRIFDESGNRIAGMEQLKRAVVFYELKQKLQGYWGDDRNIYLELAERLLSLGRSEEAMVALDKHPNPQDPKVIDLRNKIEEGMRR